MVVYFQTLTSLAPQVGPCPSVGGGIQKRNLTREALNTDRLSSGPKRQNKEAPEAVPFLNPTLRAVTA